MQKRMIFHYPFPLPKEENSGRKVRLTRMVEAFTHIGYEVVLVAGYANERKRAIRVIRKEVLRDRKFDFVYSESGTQPSLLAKRNCFRPFLDFQFFKWCKTQSISVGLFYRDVHWRYKEFKPSFAWYWRAVAPTLYWYDWLNYLRLVDYLFLPCLAIKVALPSRWPEHRMGALFPGCDVPNLCKPSTAKMPSGRLKLFYVGGVEPPIYDLKPMIDCINALDNVLLTLCCRAFEWKRVQSYYEPIDTAKIHIVHAYGDELKGYYVNSDLFCLFWRPNDYLDFAMPVKVFESLGYGVPVLTNAGTEVARFVAKEGLGWIVSTPNEMRERLLYLKSNPVEIMEKRKHVEAVREHHSWRLRAQIVADLLGRDKADT